MNNESRIKRQEARGMNKSSRLLAEGSNGMSYELQQKSKEKIIWNKKIECMNEDDMRALQGERLKKLVNRVYNHVPFYRNRMNEAGV